MPEPLRFSAASRIADTLLRAAGGRQAVLRLPAPASGLPSEQLGLATPYFQDVPISPVVFRNAGQQAGTIEMLLSATVVELTVGSLKYDSARLLFAGALGVLVDDVMLTIASSAPEQVFGKPYLYRLLLHLPAAETL